MGTAMKIENSSQIINWVQKLFCVLSLVMSGLKSCKNLARWFKTFKILSRILQDINQGKKINRGTNVLGNIFEANFCLLNKLQNRIQWKKISSDSKTCKNLARWIHNLARYLQVEIKILQDSCKMIQILQESCKLLASSMHSLPRLLARFLQDFEFVDH